MLSVNESDSSTEKRSLLFVGVTQFSYQSRPMTLPTPEAVTHLSDLSSKVVFMMVVCSSGAHTAPSWRVEIRPRWIHFNTLQKRSAFLNLSSLFRYSGFFCLFRVGLNGTKYVSLVSFYPVVLCFGVEMLGVAPVVKFHKQHFH